jgi:hypothetical protein
MVLHGMGWGSTGPERAELNGTVRGGRGERGMDQFRSSARYTARFRKTRDLPSRLGCEVRSYRYSFPRVRGSSSWSKMLSLGVLFG